MPFAFDKTWKILIITMAVLYRKYRPQKLADLVGQEHVSEALGRALSSGKVSHAYLFCGPKGTGKTTTARILAKSVNCEKYRDPKNKLKQKGTYGEPCGVCSSCVGIANGTHLDLIEIDAASNRGIDDVRELREKIKLSPVASPFKVYIIDEAHSLTADAFNALLKTLEEPPAHAIFILCTTEVSKLPQTIISRCSRFDFQRAKVSDLVSHLEKIVKAEKISAEKEILEKIAASADGSFRDSLSILDQISAGRQKIDQESLSKVLFPTKTAEIFEFLDMISSKDKKEAILFVNIKYENGDDLRLFLSQVIENLRLGLLFQAGAGEKFVRDLGEDQKGGIEKLAREWTERELFEAIRFFQNAAQDIKSAVLPQLPVELAVVSLIGSSSGAKPDSANQESPPLKDTVNQEGETENLKQKADSKRSKADGKQQTAKSKQQTSESSGEKVEVKTGQNINQNLVKSSECKEIEEILKLWPQILSTVRGENFSVEALLRGCRPADFDGKVLTLEVFYNFHKERLEDPKIEKMVSSALAKMLGHEVMLRCILGEKRVSENLPSKQGSLSTAEEFDETAQNSDDLAKAISEIFES